MAYLENVDTTQQLSFSFPELRYSLENSNLEKDAKIGRIERDYISAIKFDAARLH